MYKIILSVVLFVFSVGLFAQTGIVRGVVKDKGNGETLIGANIVFKNNPGQGTVTDFDGNFELEAPQGKTTLVVSYIGYDPQEVSVTISGVPTDITVALKSVMLDEVVIVSDFARARETPIAFTNVLPAKLEEELAGRDIPMVLNSTPGVYATEQGGGDGDARITIRGFSQRNVAVMLDGVPVNDMENGWVYWSNWFGLNVITRNIQVQRGLGASKLGIPSVGGTMNIMTKGMSNKPSSILKQEIDDFGRYNTSFGVSSGRMGNWGVTVAGSYKTGTGWADATATKGFFYYLKLERRIGKHVVSFTGFGAPQQHEQRSYKTAIGLIDSTYAADVCGIEFTEDDTTEYYIWSKGARYNQHWGYLNRWKIGENGDTIFGSTEKLNEKLNYYHKPQFSLKDTWTVNDKLFISNIAYLSIGNGGGTGLVKTQPWDENSRPDGQLNLQNIYNLNRSSNPVNGYILADRERYIYAGINNHFWLGILSSAEYQLNENLNLSGGFDLRYYKGEHYRELYDLLGGEAYLDENGNNALGYKPRYNNPSTTRYKKVGDKIYYHNDGLVKWYGGFFQAEYITPNWSSFISTSLSGTDYQRINYFAPYLTPDGATVSLIARGDATSYVSDTVNENGNQYYIGHADVSQKDKFSSWERFLGYTLKAGFNYNISERVNAFVNLGTLSKAPRFQNVFANNSNEVPANLKNEVVYALEVGSGYTSPKLSMSLNGYYTYWNNKPLDKTPSKTVDDVRYLMNITGIAARHIGIELDGVYMPIKQLEIQGVISLGDWIYNTRDSVNFVDEAGNPAPIAAISYDARGVHVGDAAQTQISGSVRYNIIKNLYAQARLTYFARYYAEFDPSQLNVEGDVDNRGRQSWKIPSFSLLDFSCGYKFNIYEKYKAQINMNVLNVLDTKHISDAQNNDTYSMSPDTNFDARSATVFMGLGRRFNVALSLFF